jgi:hypothetical protein
MCDLVDLFEAATQQCEGAILAYHPIQARLGFWFLGKELTQRGHCGSCSAQDGCGAHDAL